MDLIQSTNSIQQQLLDQVHNNETTTTSSLCRSTSKTDTNNNDNLLDASNSVPIQKEEDDDNTVPHTAIDGSQVPISDRDGNYSNDNNKRASFQLPDKKLVVLKTTTKDMKSSFRRGQLKVDRGVNFTIPTILGTALHMKEYHTEDSWRYRVVEFVHSPSVQRFLMLLLLLDIIILYTEFFLLAEYPHCSIITRDAISCCPSDNNNNNRDRFLRFLSSNNEHEPICDEGYVNEEYAAGCNNEKWHVVHTIETILFSITLFILSVFLIELNIVMIALRPTIFFKQFFYLLDYIIITISFVLEIIFHTLEDQIYQSISGILVLLRLWRFIRIGHGFIELTHNAAHEEYMELISYTKQLESILQQQHQRNVSTSASSTTNDDNGMTTTNRNNTNTSNTTTSNHESSMAWRNQLPKRPNILLLEEDEEAEH